MERIHALNQILKWVVVLLLIGLIQPNTPAAAQTDNPPRPVITADNAANLTQVGQLGYGTITSSAWSDDGTLYAIGMAYEIRIYRAGQDAPLIIPDQQMVNILAFRQDNALLASSDNSGLVHIWDLSNGALVDTWGMEDYGYVYDLFFVPETTMLAINFFDGVSLTSGSPLGTGTRLWMYGTSTEPHLIHTGYYPPEENLVLNSDHTLMATTERSSQNGSGMPVGFIYIRDISNGELIQYMGDVGYYFASLIFSPTDPRLLASIDNRGVVRVWDVTNGVELLAPTLPRDHVTTAAFTPDGTMIVTGGTDGKVRVWDVTNGALLEVFDIQPPPVERLQITDDGHIFAFSDDANEARMWDSQTLETSVSHTLFNNTPSLVDMQFDSSGDHIIAVGRDATVRTWDIATGQETVLLRGAPDTWNWDALSISSGGGYVLWMDEETYGVWRYDVRENSARRVVELEPLFAVNGINFSPATNRLFIYGSSATVPYEDSGSMMGDRIPDLRMWTLESDSTAIDEMSLFDDYVYSVVSSSAEPIIAYTTGDHVILRDVTDGTETILLEHESPYGVNMTFSPDGRLMGLLQGNLYVWDVDTRSSTLAVDLLQYASSHSTLAFHPDNTLIVIGDGDTLTLIDVTDGSALTIVEDTHIDQITQVAFSPDGTLIATASLDGTIRLWGAE